MYLDVIIKNLVNKNGSFNYKVKYEGIDIMHEAWKNQNIIYKHQ